MAQSKSFFGMRRGSTKSHTYSVFNGKQVTKDRVEEVKNPRSQAQMLQRMVLKTTGQAYSAMKQIVDHSFEGKTYGLQSMMAFQSANAKDIRVCADKCAAGETVTSNGYMFVEYGAKGFVAGNYVMSEGSATKIKKSPVIDNTVANNLTIKLLGSENKATTAADLFTLLGISVGDLCTVCFVWQNSLTNEWEFDFVRITALATGDVALTSANYSTYIKIESTLELGTIAFGTANTPNGISVTVATNQTDDSTIVAGVAIHSVLSDGKWLRSTTHLDFGANIDPLVSFDEAMPTYPVGNTYVLNGGNF